ncbi:MAG TPA: ribonuclease Y [Candidatus Polarisedimenticolaceae bacterium]|nr:ribonuclease Y [Candidatus Polarisedimenticolaceae bacterium]
MSVLGIVLVGAAAAAAGAALGWFLNNRLGAFSLDAARQKGEEIQRAAGREAESLKRQQIVEAREQILREKSKAEGDLRSRKGQLAKRERELKLLRDSLTELEADIQRQREVLREGEQGLAAREVELRHGQEALEHMVHEENARLERASGLTRDEARRQLLQNLKAEVRFEAAAMVKEIKDEAQRGAEAEAQKIVSLAMERIASDLSAERTVTHFALPSGGQMRGRIIGHEGKNIKAFEQVTGIQLLLDEAGESVQLSGFNPVKREVARRVLEMLLRDGNIHPKRIEELTRRNARRLEDEMRRAGEQTLKEMEIQEVQPEMVKLLGRLLYRTSYGQNVLMHSKEVGYLTGIMAAELGLDEMRARRAGLFHDIGKAVDYEREGTHPEIGAEVAVRCGEHWEVVNAIAAHHEDVEVTTPITILVATADALSGARPGARRKSVAEYIRRIEQLEGLANAMEGVEQSYALQAGREIRVIANTAIVDDARIGLLASDLARRIESEMDYPGKIKVTVIREIRAQEVAR